MPTTQSPYLVPADAGEPARCYADELLVKVAAEGLEIAEGVLLAGSEPPLHRHTGADQHLYVLDGSLRVRIGDDEVIVDAGALVTLPRGVAHAHTVTSGTARVLILTHGHSSGIAAFAAAGTEAFGPDGMPSVPTPAGDDRLALALAPRGVEIVGPHPLRAGQA